LNGRRLRAEREAERIFELSPALLAVVGFDGYLRRFNPAFEVLGYSGEELLSRKWIEFVHPNDRERMLQAADSRAVSMSWRWTIGSSVATARCAGWCGACASCRRKASSMPLAAT
jgi:PAS domain-containing protein